MSSNHDQSNQLIGIVPASSVFESRKITEIYDEITSFYKTDRRPWVIGFSGGKDSTVALQLVWEALARLPEAKRTKPVHVISSDTLVESPVITAYIGSILAKINAAAGHPVSERTVNRLLHELGYSLQANRKTLEGKQHADRDKQFKHINRRVRAFQRLRQPVVSVDTKKKELIGEFRNGGREWRPQRDPQRVKVHDFIDEHLGKAIPYGVYDVTRDSGWVSVGEDHDTAAFAVETLRRWWLRMGVVAYRQAKRLLITADGGGSNCSRSRLWKVE